MSVYTYIELQWVLYLILYRVQHSRTPHCVIPDIVPDIVNSYIGPNVPICGYCKTTSGTTKLNTTLCTQRCRTQCGPASNSGCKCFIPHANMKWKIKGSVTPLGILGPSRWCGCRLLSWNLWCRFWRRVSRMRGVDFVIVLSTKWSLKHQWARREQESRLSCSIGLSL